VQPAVTAADSLAAFVLGRALLQEHLEGRPSANLAVTAGLLAIAAGMGLTTPPGASGASGQEEAASRDGRPVRTRRKCTLGGGSAAAGFSAAFVAAGQLRW
jgi:hypothetical protein